MPNKIDWLKMENDIRVILRDCQAAPMAALVSIDNILAAHTRRGNELAADVGRELGAVGFTVEIDDCLIGYAAQLAADGLEQTTSNNSKLPCGIYAIVEPCGAVFSFVRHDNTGQFFAVSNDALAVMRRAE